MEEHPKKPRAFYIAHAGEILADVLAARGIGYDEFASDVGCDIGELLRVLRGDVQMSDALAGRVADALETSKEFWMSLSKGCTTREGDDDGSCD